MVGKHYHSANVTPRDLSLTRKKNQLPTLCGLFHSPIKHPFYRGLFFNES